VYDVNFQWLVGVEANIFVEAFHKNQKKNQVCQVRKGEMMLSYAHVILVHNMFLEVLVFDLITAGVTYAHY
jgi:hypothetical protein